MTNSSSSMFHHQTLTKSISMVAISHRDIDGELQLLNDLLVHLHPILLSPSCSVLLKGIFKLSDCHLLILLRPIHTFQ